MSFGGISFTDLTSSTLLAGVIVLILLGRLVPRSILQDKIQERDRWREAYESEREARAAAEAQTQELIDRTRHLHDSLSVNHSEMDSSIFTEG